MFVAACFCRLCVSGRLIVLACDVFLAAGVSRRCVCGRWGEQVMCL